MTAKTKIISTLFYLLIIISCKPGDNQEIESGIPIQSREVQYQYFQQIIDSAQVTGSILIFDTKKNIYYSNNFDRCRKGFLPASTFKIPNSIIALETGVVESDSSILKWDGKKRRLPVWEKDLSLRDAFHVSCVPCYQEIARKIGPQRMRTYLDKFEYGKIIFDSTTIDMFWLEGPSEINQFQQIEFLQKLYKSTLPVSEKTIATMKRLMVIEENENYKLSGKTGWAIRNENNYGWFVGYIEKGKDVYYIATNIEPKESFNMDLFPKIRNEVSMAAFNNLMQSGK